LDTKSAGQFYANNFAYMLYTLSTI